MKDRIRFKAKLLRPKARGTWSFLVLPRAASARLPTRSALTVEGTINGHAFRAALEPDGQKSHWLKVPGKLRASAGADVGDVVQVELAPSAKTLEAAVPADLRKSLAAVPKARAVWLAITPVARRDWILWIVSAKQPATRARRIRNACDMLGKGKRRVCCFDRSGFYSQGLCAPEVDEGA